MIFSLNVNLIKKNQFFTYMLIKQVIQNIINKMGYAVYKRDSRLHPEASLKYLCVKNNLNVILDVGANIGQYGITVRNWDYTGRILSFEPLSSAHSILSRNAAKDPRWQVAPRCAIGAETAISEINIAGNSVSSSLLEMLESHKEVAPESTYVDKEEVRIETLNHMIHSMCNPDDQFYLKIDTQGYERQVILGAAASLDRIPLIQMELSIRPLYATGLLIDDGIELMKSYGYRLYSIHPVLTDRRSGESLQVDVIFVRV